jgi:hypothetical protein
MGNVYSAQNVAAHFVYELNEVHTFINQISIQLLLKQVDKAWQQAFGHSAYHEQVHCLDSTGYYVQEVYEAYLENGFNHVSLPAREWFLKYGEFQLVYRTYGVPAFTEPEQKIVDAILDRYRDSSAYDDIAV